MVDSLQHFHHNNLNRIIMREANKLETYYKNISI